jgi:hypothetical protein
MGPATRTAISGFGRSNALSEDGISSSRLLAKLQSTPGRCSNGDSFCPERLDNESQRKRDQEGDMRVDQVSNHPSHLKCDFTWSQPR